ncbi:MAG TPA: triose-phosphate isomerase [Armatimonadota bacterium]|jgi:triosephosphate isomerase
MRRIFVAGNWKMNLTVAESVALAEELKAAVKGAKCDVAVAPTFVAIYPVAEALKGSEIAVSAQNTFWKEKGAYTSQVSPQLLKAAGTAWVIVGHSETRGRFGVEEKVEDADALKVFGDTDASVNLKARYALANGLNVIVACGELLGERQAGTTDAVVSAQIERGLKDITADEMAKVVIAYEPVWAIGTGEVCAADEANRVCGVIRNTVKKLYGQAVSEATRIQYGGSVKASNAAALFAMENIDGALVGGAALKAADFLGIINAA